MASSAVDHNLHIWSVLDGPNGHNRIDQFLLSLSGHQEALITALYNKTPFHRRFLWRWRCPH